MAGVERAPTVTALEPVPEPAAPGVLAGGVGGSETSGSEPVRETVALAVAAAHLPTPAREEETPATGVTAVLGAEPPPAPPPESAQELAPQPESMLLATSGQPEPERPQAPTPVDDVDAIGLPADAGAIEPTAVVEAVSPAAAPGVIAMQEQVELAGVAGAISEGDAAMRARRYVDAMRAYGRALRTLREGKPF
jgi:hypothetical protein